MQIKRFRGASVREAISRVKKEFGKEALIVETKTLGEGLFEVVAAIDRDEPVTAPMGAWATGVSAECLLREMEEIKDLLLSISGHDRGEGKALRLFRKELQRKGLDRTLVMRLLARARAGAGKGSAAGLAGKGGTDMRGLREAVRKELVRYISVKNPLKESRIISFIGPTGAGKTTTMAKLGVMAGIAKKKRVVMLTMDTFRIGAPEQVLKYARMMDAPAGVASTVDEAAEFVSRHSGADLVLIDTPGFGGAGNPHVRGIRDLAARIPGLRFNVVLSVREREECLRESLRGLGALPIDSLTFTKLDEAGAVGQMLGLSVRSKRPISFLGTGQRVPGDIVEATVEGLLGYLVPYGVDRPGGLEREKR